MRKWTEVRRTYTPPISGSLKYGDMRAWGPEADRLAADMIASIDMVENREYDVKQG